jgi:hypothetical protein
MTANTRRRTENSQLSTVLSLLLAPDERGANDSFCNGGRRTCLRDKDFCPMT